MSAQFTNNQIRAAILRAADNIASGAPYDFNGHGVTGVGILFRGCAPCMWGHIGRELGLVAQTNLDIANAIGMRETSDLYQLRPANGSHHNPADAATMLRAYADKYFPAEKQDDARDPAFTRFMDTFAKSMEAA
jgi:hypothetical protein